MNEFKLMTKCVHMTPVLYSFRRCPYAIRARMALIFAQQTIDLIEVDLKNKPAELLALSPKGTVPVLKVDDTTLLEESLDIIPNPQIETIKIAQPLNAQSKPKNFLITNEVTTKFLDSLCTSSDYTLFTFLSEDLG